MPEGGTVYEGLGVPGDDHDFHLFLPHKEAPIITTETKRHK